MALDDWPLVPLLGAGAVLISVFGILGVLFTVPWFSVYENTLSDLGRSGRSSAPVFNSALVASGVLGMGFVAGLWRRSVTAIKCLGIALFGVSVASVVFVGVFPTPHPYHYPAAVGFYLALTFALFVYGTGDALAGKLQFGLTTIWLGIVHTTSWIVWWTLMDGRGIAGPEVIGVVVFWVWACGMVWRSYQSFFNRT